MPRGHHTPLYYKVVAALENWLDLRACHMADGVVSEEEEAAERAYMLSVVLPIAVDNAEASHLAAAILRYGPEVDSVERLMTRRRQRRMFTPVPELDDVSCAA